ncbi:hypothetical protein E1176_16795 [Fulvivirga sp. RKSG066]|uniref:DUF6804 family protein n=1 Tax=Fulvivirga aurantia TaxID=2529383 RepID=UPI0012BCF927|nr:DUF6804 family protein [Fulvivirga aurantia]MTI22693.1 hypothetical protein [Fulvivirga aurantia]
MNKIVLIKLILALGLLICLLDMPYGYYQFIRFAALVGFAILAFNCYESNNQQLAIFYVVLALLFQPFLKISLGRELWNVVDVIAAVILIGSTFKRKNSTQ